MRCSGCCCFCLLFCFACVGRDYAHKPCTTLGGVAIPVETTTTLPVRSSAWTASCRRRVHHQIEIQREGRETNLDRTQLRTRDAADDHEHNQRRLCRMGMRSVAHERPKHAQACLQQTARGSLPEQVSTCHECTRDLVKPDSPFGQSGWTQDSPLHVQSVQAYDGRE
jgi:hypothetical protein